MISPTTLVRPATSSNARLAVAGLCSICAFYFLSMVLLTADGLTDSIETVDVIVVLGNEVYESGEPSERLAARLDRAAELYLDGVSPNLIVSGGVGESGFDEAVVMKDYLIESGVPGEAVVADSLGVNTRATAVNAKQIMRDRGWASVMVVSQFYHISRTKLAFSQEGSAVSGSAHAQFFESRDVFSTIREVPAFAKYLLL